jgi:hypothetical protein
MAFNVQAAKQAGYSDEEINSYLSSRSASQPQEKKMNPLLNLVLGNSLRVANDVGSGIGTRMRQGSQDQSIQNANDLVNLAGRTTDSAKKQALYRQAQGLYGNVHSNATADANSFSEDVNQNPLWRGLKSGTEIASLAEAPDAVMKAGKFLKMLNPRNTGKLIEETAAKGGEVPVDKLVQKFGSINNPNPELIKGLSSASGKQDLIDVLNREIMNQGRSAGGEIAQPTYSDILDLRKGSYSQAYDKLVPKSQQGLYKNIGRAYDAILKEGVPDIAAPDKMYSLLSKVNGSKKTIGKIAGGILAYRLINNALSGAGKIGK